MEFRDILTMASEQQGLSNVPKRYSLAVGPPKKDPKVKGVHSAAVQAFLRRQEEEQRKKVLEEKRRKEELLAKRVELKHDRKARAMASRTKDNFHGYNGIPVEEKPRKRQNSENRNSEFMKDDDIMQASLTQSDSEPESVESEEQPSRISEKPKVLSRSAPPVMNFNDLLKLAEKKQHEPVEIKVVKKTEERPMTAEELKEREYLEKRNRKVAVLKEKKLEKELKHTVASGFSKKDTSQKKFVNTKLSKHSADKHSFSKESVSSQTSTNKNSKRPALSEKPSKLAPYSKASHPEKTKPAHKGLLKSPPNSNHIKSAHSGGGKTGSKPHSPVLKTAANGALRQSSTKEPCVKKDMVHKKLTSVASTQQESYKNSISRQTSNNLVARGLPVQPKSSLKTGQPTSSSVTGHKSCSSGLRRSENISGQGQQSRTSSTGPSQAGSCLNVRSGRPGVNLGPLRLDRSQGVSRGCPNTSVNTGMGRGGGSGPGRPSTTSVQNLKPKCTVVSETISSKNLVPRQDKSQMNGMRPFSHQRSGIPQQGFPKTSLPPISYKRQFDDEDEYDSEMEDFIDDEGEPQEEISKHIREIFGYDRSRYKDESDYALRYMESSWKDQQKEEAKSLRLGMQEDLEEMRREEEELKRRKQAKKLRTH